MDIILTQDVEYVGSSGELVTVKDGYARNYLIPKKLAVVATESAKKMHAENTKQRAHKEAKLIEEANQVAEKLANKKFKIGAKVSDTGKIFGSVNTIQLAEVINSKGFDIDRKQIKLPSENIKEAGDYTAQIKLHKKVVVDLDFKVVGE